MRSLLLLLGLSACGPSQWAVSIGTDAPVPQFGDRLFIEVLDEKGTIAQRLIGVGAPADWPVSFGIAPEAPRGLPLHLRARLYRADHASTNGLPDVAYLDALGRLPDLVGHTSTGLVLSLNCFGVPSGPMPGGPTCDPRIGTAGPVPLLPEIDAKQLPVPGSWGAAQQGECPTAPPEGMVCIPGGTFVLGGPHYFPIRDWLASQPERMVRLRPFALDQFEFTVGHYEQLRRQHADLRAPYLYMADATHIQHACLFRGTEADRDSPLPLNCIPQVLAAQACALEGKRLPTEAEWEYAAGNLGLETAWPWGEDDDVCQRAAVGLGRGLLEHSYFDEDTSCRSSGTGRVRPWGPVAGGHAGDVTLRGLHDMGGNLAEWVQPGFGTYHDPCWQPGRIWLDNPHCREPLPAYQNHLPRRGGSWMLYPFYARVVQRGATVDMASVDVGFRCAKAL